MLVLLVLSGLLPPSSALPSSKLHMVTGEYSETPIHRVAPTRVSSVMTFILGLHNYDLVQYIEYFPTLYRRASPGDCHPV